TTVAHSARILARHPHVPRITIDRLVVQRETWSFPAHELEFATRRTAHERFLAARRWRLRHDLANEVFATLPLEPKPIFVDLASPILVEILARFVRRALAEGAAEAPVVLGELLPGLDRLWLTDAAGNRYTSE